MSDVEDALYTDPRLVAVYDLFNAGDRDFAFYASRIGPARQRILDLGCGTGTFARRLAAAGHDVVAIDPAPAMIDYARRRPGTDAVRWIACDLGRLPPGAPFDAVVMTGHAFQCLLTDADIDATLHGVRRVLADGGRFLFDTRNPRVAPWRAWTPRHSACVAVSSGSTCTSASLEPSYVQRERHFGEDVLVTRKGAVSARKGQLGIIPGSTGAKNFIVRGLGNPESFCSCSHGAGRTMSRTEAKRRFTADDQMKAMQGVECRKDAGVVDEIPMAYKDIDAVMAARRSLVEVVHTLRQVVCVKG